MENGIVRFLLAGGNTIEVSDMDCVRLCELLSHYSGLLVEFDRASLVCVLTSYRNNKQNGIWKLRSQRIDYKTIKEFCLLSAIYSGDCVTDEVEHIATWYYGSPEDFDYMVDYYRRYASATYERSVNDEINRRLGY